ncbi:MAG: ABC transporter ATP-binding protein, partial [Gammaproteobacteria bacterium]|nr:ABC transporter ATP-binding protein [Gammaproteobacteria bacterium]
GEAHALLGSSGAGKTTLLNILSGLEPPSGGRVLFDGRDVTRTTPRERNVSQVFQFPVLYESLTVAQNLEFPLKLKRVRGPERRRRALAIAERLSLADLLESKPAALSLFEKQLVAIGRALVRPEVSVVLLDEPLTAVEPATKWQLRQVLKSAQAELGATMIYVTHDQTEALTFAENISVLHEGQIVQTGSAETLFNLPNHEHVAHFIGSPGMNLVVGEITDGAYRIAGQVVASAAGLDPGPCTIGFRPEWAVATRRDADASASGLPARVTAVRVLGVRHGQRQGLVSAQLAGTQINLRQTLNVEPGDQALVQIRGELVIGFRNGQRLSADSVRSVSEVSYRDP